MWRGWKQGRPVRASVLLMCLLPMTVHAMDAEETPAEIPDGFLEFLGMMVEQDGELIDPLALGRLDDPIDVADGGRQTVDTAADSDGNKQLEEDPDE